MVLRMSDTAREHRSTSPTQVRCGVVTVSDTRTLETDTSGQTLVEFLAAAGHTVVQRDVIPDDPERLIQLVTAAQSRADLDALLLTGGTGLSSRDQTCETLSRLITRPLPGYGELFRWLSFQEIGPAAMLSRAVGGLAGRLVVLSMPGSPAAVQLAMSRLILPELGHLVREARR